MQQQSHWTDWVSRHLAALAIFFVLARLLQAAPPRSAMAGPGGELPAPPPGLVDAELSLEMLLCRELSGGARRIPQVTLPLEVTALADVVRCRARFVGAPARFAGEIYGSFRWEVDGTTVGGARRTARGDGSGAITLTTQGLKLEGIHLVAGEVVERRSPRFTRIAPELPAGFRAPLVDPSAGALSYAAELSRAGGALAAVDLDGDGLPDLVAARGRQALRIANRGGMQFEAIALEVAPVPLGIYVAALPLDGGAGREPLVALVSSTGRGKSRIELRVGSELRAGPALDLDHPVTAAAGSNDRFYLAGPGGIDTVLVAGGAPRVVAHAASKFAAVDATLADTLGLGRPQLILAGPSGLAAWDPAAGGETLKELATGSFVSADAGDAVGAGQLALLGAGLGQARERALALGVPADRLAPIARLAEGSTLATRSGAQRFDAGSAFSFGSVLADVDDDGRLDALFATGLASALGGLRLEEEYFRRIAAVEVADGLLPPHLFGWEQKRFVQGSDHGEVAFVEGFDEVGDGRSLLAVDLDGDGHLDLAMLGRDRPGLVLFRNRGGGNALSLFLRDAAGAPAQAAVAILDAPDGAARSFATGSGRGYHAAALLPVHLGLGARTSARIQVRWASGLVQELGQLDAGQWEVREGAEPVRRALRAAPARAAAHGLTAAALGLPRGKPGLALVGAIRCGACTAAAARLPSFAEGENTVVVAWGEHPDEVARDLGLRRVRRMTPEISAAFARPLNPGALLVFKKDGSLERVLRDPRGVDAFLAERLPQPTAQLDRRTP